MTPMTRLFYYSQSCFFLRVSCCCATYDQGADGAQGSDALARAVVELDLDHAGLGVGEADSQVTEVLGKLATGALNDDIPGLDGDLDPLGDFEQFLRVAVERLSVQFVQFEFCDALVRARFDYVQEPGFEKLCANRRIERCGREIDIHVLHLEGCCWLAIVDGCSVNLAR